MLPIVSPVSLVVQWLLMSEKKLMIKVQFLYEAVGISFYAGTLLSPTLAK